jgi:NMD protein affecting ribosome stability and mRNA decay
MSYKCPECGEIFEEPIYETVCMEEYCGVSTMFSDRHYATFMNCPKCGAPIDNEYDTWDEAYEDDDDDDEE